MIENKAVQTLVAAHEVQLVNYLTATGIEIGLLLIFLIHVYKTVRMFLGNQTARPVRYAKKKYAGRPSRKTFASSTMIASLLSTR